MASALGDHPKYEVAAYQVSELLGLKIVPTTVWRDEGSFQLWMNDLKEEKGTQPPNDAMFFDFVIDQQDRYSLNLPDYKIYKNWGTTKKFTCILYDHEYTFGPKISNIPHEISQFIPSAGVLEKAKELDMEKLESVDFLSREEKEAVLLRRDRLIQAIEAYK
jgi:hypothetical protein